MSVVRPPVTDKNTVTEILLDLLITALSAGGITGSAVKAATSAVTRITSTGASQTILAANTTRVSAIIQNEGPGLLYVKYGTTASATSYTVALQPQGTVIVDDYNGKLDGIFDTDGGNAQVTQLTP